MLDIVPPLSDTPVMSRRNAADPIVLVTISLRQSERERLNAICAERGQGKSDFVRAAIGVAAKVPDTRTPRPLTGACLELHKAKVRRDRRRAKKKG